MVRAANSIAESKHADQPAAKSCSGLVPVPGLPGRESLTSRRPSELRDTPVRPLEPIHNVLLHEEPRRLDALRSSFAIGEVA